MIQILKNRSESSLFNLQISFSELNMPCGIVSGVNLCCVEPYISNPISLPTSTSFPLLRKEFTVLFGIHPELKAQKTNNNRGSLKFQSYKQCQVSSVGKASECNTGGLGSQVQSQLEVNFLLNLFCSSLRSITKMPTLPTLCSYGKTQMMVVRLCSVFVSVLVAAKEVAGR